jgi:hypothetical protein
MKSLLVFMMKRIFSFLLVILLSSCSVISTKKRIEFSNYGSFSFPKNWVVSFLGDGAVISDKALNKDHNIIASVDTLVPCGDNFCQEVDYIGEIVLLRALPNGKGLSGSNDVVSTEMVVQVNGIEKNLYVIFLQNGLTIVFLSESVSWFSVTVIADSYSPKD